MRKSCYYILLYVLIVASVMLTNKSSAHAHFLGFDSVDGSALHYQRYTPWFSDAVDWAASQWRDLGGNIGIVEGYYAPGITLQIKTAYDPNAPWDGAYYNWSHEIFFNTYYTNTYNQDEKRALATHEFGHALGLAHSYYGQIMYGCSTCSGVTTPQNHDRQDFYTLWSN